LILEASVSSLANSMIIMLNRSGQLGNQLMLFSKFITLSLEENLDLMNPTFAEYGDSFTYFEKNPLSEIPQKKLFWSKGNTRTWLFPHLMRLLAFATEHLAFLRTRYEVVRAGQGKKFNLADQEFIEQCRNKTVFFLDGWPRLQVNYKANYANRLREIFTPLSKHRRVISAREKEGRQLGEILIGVHVRQGDYRFWENGKYFFESEMYVGVMDRVKSMFQDKQISFFVASDEVQEKKLFDRHAVVFGGEDAIEDMYTLAACDYIIAPPSTFSAWASFYGKTPRYTIKEIEKTFDLEDFVTPTA
jgi:hypothetical protein